jgi:hypothetical protein
MSCVKGGSVFIAGLCVGASVAVMLTLRLASKPAEPHHEVRYHPYYDPAPERLLYRDGTTLEKIFPEAKVLAAIRSPDRMTIHQVDSEGGIEVGEYRFSSQAHVPSSETAARMTYALSSLNTYELPGAACMFTPVILLRLTKDGAVHDLMFCFNCCAMGGAAGVGMSQRGSEVFLKCFCETLPDFEELQAFRRKATLRQNGLPALD